MRQNKDAIRARCKTLSGFIKEAWHVIEPGVNYVHNWHVDAVAEHLEAITWGRLLRLGATNRVIFNQPPGTMKSLMVSVFWQAWEWGPCNMPHLRYLSTSYSEDYVRRDCRKTRDLILSSWFQELWGQQFVMTRVGESSFANDKMGNREGVPFKSLTGGRGDRLVIDDPHSVDTAESPTELASTIRTFRESATSRLNDARESAIAIMMQRLNEGDVTGVALKLGQGYQHVRLPMEYESDNPCETIIQFKDPRQFDGELLFPERFPKEVVERDKIALGSYAVAAQYQQRPSPRGGGMFKKDWFEIVPAIPAGAVVWVRGWDLAATEQKKKIVSGISGGPAFTRGVKLGRYSDGTYIVADIVGGQLSPGKVESLIKNTASQDNANGLCIQDLPQDPGQAGKSQIRTLVSMLNGYPVRWSPETGSKEQRADPVAAQAEVGNVKILAAPWNDAFLDELSLFPTGMRKDQVDALSRAFARLTKARPDEGFVGPRIISSSH